VYLKNHNAFSLLYIKGMILDGKLTESTDLFARVSAGPTSTDLQYFASLRSAQQLYLQKRYEEVKAVYWQARNYTPTAALSDRLEEKIELCDYIPLEIQ
jgi:hypothetical protein